MDENFNNDPGNEQQKDDRHDPVDETSTSYHQNADIRNFTMDNRGEIHADRNGTASVSTSSRMFLILGWISAAFAAFISPYFAIAGIVFGVLANRQVRGSGTAVIITNIILAAINILFGFMLIMAARRIFIGY